MNCIHLSIAWDCSAEKNLSKLDIFSLTLIKMGFACRKSNINFQYRLGVKWPALLDNYSVNEIECKWRKNGRIIGRENDNKWPFLFFFRVLDEKKRQNEGKIDWKYGRTMSYVLIGRRKKKIKYYMANFSNF